MVTRRSFLALLALLPFARPAKAVTRANSMTEGFNLAYGRRAGMSYAKAKADVRGIALDLFLQERDRDFSYRDEAAWPGWFKDERAQRLKDSKPGSEERARWALWNAWYEQGNTEPLKVLNFFSLAQERLQSCRDFVERRIRIEGSEDVHEPLWPGWTIEERLSQVIGLDYDVKNNIPCQEPHNWEYLRGRWLEPYKWAGLFFSGTWKPEYLELPCTICKGTGWVPHPEKPFTDKRCRCKLKVKSS